MQLRQTLQVFCKAESIGTQSSAMPLQLFWEAKSIGPAATAGAQQCHCSYFWSAHFLLLECPFFYQHNGHGHCRYFGEATSVATTGIFVRHNNQALQHCLTAVFWSALFIFQNAFFFLSV